MKVLIFILLLVLDWTTINKAASAYSQTFALLCLGKHGDYLLHPQDCSKFIRCSHSRAFEFQCADKLLWNHEIKSCDYLKNVKCMINDKQRMTTTKTFKFKREIPNMNEKIAAATKMPEKLSTVLNQLTALTTSTKATEIFPTSPHLPEFSFQTSQTLSNKLFKTPKDQITIFPCITANISGYIDLTEKNHTESINDNENTARENLLNLTTNNGKLTTYEMKFPTPIELITTQQVEIKKITNLSVNLTEETFDVLNINTEKMETTSEEVESSYRDSTTDTKTTELNLEEFTIFSPNITEKLVNSTEEIFKNLTTKKFETTTSSMLERLTEADTSAIELTTDYRELPETTNLSVNLTTEFLVNSPAETFINLTTNKLELPETTNLSVNMTTEFLVDSPAETFINLTTNQLESSNPIELPTDQALPIESIILSATEIRNQDETTTTIELPMINTFIKVTTESSVSFITTTYHSTADPLQSTSIHELPTDQSEFLETTNALINLTENIENLQTSKTDHFESTRLNELPTATGNSLNLTTENVLATLKPELKTDHFKTGSSEVVPTHELTTTTKTEFHSGQLELELPTTVEELTETTTKLINLKTDNEELFTDDMMESTSSTSLLNFDQTDLTSSLSIHVTIANNSTDMEKGNLINLPKESLGNFKAESTTNLLESVNSTTIENLDKKTTAPTNQAEIATISSITAVFEEPTKQEISTILPKKSPHKSDEDKINTLENSMTTMQSTSTALSLEASTTIDPRLPYRSALCQGENNRRKFMASRCYQYYQCFAGWAFLLNCHDGWLFQADIAACTQDVNNECKL